HGRPEPGRADRRGQVLCQRQCGGFLTPGLGLPAAGRGGVGDSGGYLEVLTEKGAMNPAEGAKLWKAPLYIGIHLLYNSRRPPRRHRGVEFCVDTEVISQWIKA